MSEEQKIIQKMATMDVNDPRRQNSAGSRGPPDGGRRPPPGGDGYGGRPSGESQRSGQPRGFPPQPQGYGPPPGQRSRPGPGPGYGAPGRQGQDQGYQQPSSQPTSPMYDSFGPPSRSMTMPNEMNAPMGQGNQRLPQGSGVGPSAPYNGPAGRMPARPSTATGSRPNPQRQFPPEVPQQAFANGDANGFKPGHQKSESISDLYDSYYDPAPQQSGPPQGNGRPGSLTSEIPDFDRVPTTAGVHKRGMSIDEHIHSEQGTSAPARKQVQGYQAMNHTKSQPDLRAQAQPQAAVYEMAFDAPPMPNGQQSGFGDQNYDQYGNAPRNGYNGYDQGYSQPQRNGPGNQGPPGPAGRGGLPSGPAPPNRGMGVPPPRSNSIPQQLGNGDPSHPMPVRAGLIPNSVANQANNKPAPVRNYGGAPNMVSIQAPGAAVNNAAPESKPVTLDEIERLKAMVKANPNDQESQLNLVKKWIEASEVLVATMPDPRARNKAREKYIFDAHKLLKKLVTAQNAEAMFLLADCYGRGSLGLESDNKEAFSLYQSAAKAGHPAAAYRTAVCCELGNDEGGGTRKDPLKAIQWYKRAAMLGDTPAMYKMGMIQLKGLLGQPKNPREAIGWLKRAAERADHENPHALHELGLLYESQQPPDGSSNIIRDEAYSLSLFQQAADLSYKFSQFRLGCAYEYGLFNLPIDPRLSIMWYSRAAVQEEHQSELALSGWYLTGSEGVLQQSDTEAYLWARKAAMAGLAKAEYAMGYFTEVGIGAPADLEAAKRWYWRASGKSISLPTQ